MIRDRDIAPLIRSWLRDGLDDSAERVLDAALAIVATTPQRPATRWPARRIDMNLIVRLGVAAAVLAMAVALGYSLFQNIGADEPAPAPSEPASEPSEPAPPDEGAAVGVLPAELEFAWIAEPRPVAGIDTGDRLVVDLRSQVFSVTTDIGAVSLVSAPTIDDAGRLRLETVVDGTGCAVGDVGTYAYSLSPGETVLTIGDAADDCSPRADALRGDLRRSACRAQGVPCLGVMEAGSQSTLLFDPFRDTFNPPTARYGAMTYTVPDGWANADDRTHFYTLLRADQYVEEAPFNCLDCPDGIWIGAQPRASLQDCSDASDESVGTSAEALAAWVRAHPGLAVADGDAVTVAGRSTIVLDIVAPQGDDACVDPVDNVSFVPLFSHPGYDYGIRVGDRHRLLLVEIDADSAMLIGIDSFDPGDLDALIAETLSIIESIELTAP